MARVSYVDDEELPEEYRGRGLTETQLPREEMDEAYVHLLRGNQRNVHRLLANLPGVLVAFRELGGAIREAIDLDPIERELVILGTARGLDCAYVWHQHVRIALSTGVPRELVAAVGEGDFDALGDDRRVLVSYASACASGAVDDATFRSLRERYDEPTVVGISLLSGFYTMLCRSMDALDIDVEEPFVGWELENADPD